MNGFAGGLARGLGQGFTLGERMNDQVERNRMRGVLAQHGPGIARGDQEAIGALAQIDPMAALRAQQGAQSLQQGALAMEAQRRDAAMKRRGQLAAVVGLSKTPEAFQQAMGVADELGLLEGVDRNLFSFQNRDALVRSSMSALQAIGNERDAELAQLGVQEMKQRMALAQERARLARAKPPSPFTAAAKINADLRNGLISEEQAQAALAGLNAPAGIDPNSIDALNAEIKLGRAYDRDLGSFPEMADQFRALEADYQGSIAGNPASQRALIFSFAKTLDPTSVVRTEEGEMLRNTAGIPDWLYTTYTAAIDGQNLTRKQIDQIRDAALSRVAAAQPAAQRAYEGAVSRAERFGLDPSFLTQPPRFDARPADFGSMPLSDVVGEAMGAGPGPGLGPRRRVE